MKGLEIISRVYLLMLVSLASTATLAQSEEETVQMIMDWQIGDKRLVETKNSSSFKVNDSIIASFNGTSSYVLEVVDTVGGFLLSHKQQETDVSAVLEGIPNLDNSANDILRQLLTGTFEKLEGAELIVFVDRDSGYATEVRNEEDVLKRINEVVVSIFEELGREKNRSDEDIEELKTKIDALVFGMRDKVIQTVLNEINIVIQMYSVEFIVNSEITHDVMVYDVNELGPYADAEIPAQMVVSSVQNDVDFTIEISTETIYDEYALNQTIREGNSDLDENSDPIQIEEKSKYNFDLGSGWILNYSEFMRFEMGITKGNSVSTTTFTKI